MPSTGAGNTTVDATAGVFHSHLFQLGVQIRIVRQLEHARIQSAPQIAHRRIAGGRGPRLTRTANPAVEKRSCTSLLKCWSAITSFAP